MALLTTDRTIVSATFTHRQKIHPILATQQQSIAALCPLLISYPAEAELAIELQITRTYTILHILSNVNS